MLKGVQQSKDEYHKGIVGGAVQAQSMTTVIEGESSLYTQGIDGGAVLRRRVCQRCDGRGNSKYYKEGPSNTRSQSYRLLAKLSSYTY
jgi:hypothetical protein